MEQQLGRSAFSTGSTPALADVANYSYASCAPKDNVSLADYLQSRAWLARMVALPRFLPMVKSSIGLAV